MSACPGGQPPFPSYGGAHLIAQAQTVKKKLFQNSRILCLASAEFVFITRREEGKKKVFSDPVFTK